MQGTWLRLLGIFILVASGCGHESEPPPEYPPAAENEGDTETDVTQTETPTEISPPEAPAVHVTVADNTPIEGAHPTIKIRSPKNNQTIKKGDVKLSLQVAGWPLAPDPGNHVHVIVDNEPYIAVRDVSKPLNLNELVQQNLNHELSEGTHLVRVFPSRGQHESVKEPGAFATVVFHNRTKTEGFTFDAKAPLLTYSRPKGCNKAGEALLLDFYLANVDALAVGGTRVRYSIDETVTGDITEWKPHHIENVAEGDHTIHLQLIDKDGNLIPGAYNDTQRTIQVSSSCPPQPATPAASEESHEDHQH